MTAKTLLVGIASDATQHLADALDAATHWMPDSEDDAALDAWRSEVAAGDAATALVIACPGREPAKGAVLDIGADAWRTRADLPLLRWSLALGAASARCADGGRLVACVEGPAPLDAAGWVPEAGLVDAVSALTRSLAHSEGARGVRANTVVVPQPGAPPVEALLPGHPGDPGAPVAATVAWLLSDAAQGITGQSLPVDFGRSW